MNLESRGAKMKALNTFQKYFVEEFHEDYRDGLINRREFIRMVAYITGSIAATVIKPSGGEVAVLCTNLSACLKLQNVSGNSG